MRGDADLRFTLLGVFGGVGTIVIQYRDQTGREVCEVMTFRDGLGSVGHAPWSRRGLLNRAITAGSAPGACAIGEGG